MKQIKLPVWIMSIAFCFCAGDIVAQAQEKSTVQRQQKGFWSQLNEDQKQQIQDKQNELFDAGASRKEIAIAIHEMLTSFGIQVPERRKKHDGFTRFGPHRFASFFKELDENQKRVIQEKHQELRQAGKTPEEIHAEIGTLLQSFGLELPENWENLQNRGRKERRFRGGFIADLTEEQRKKIGDTLKELKENNASSDEVNLRIKGLLENFGVEVPENFHIHPRYNRRGFGLRHGFRTELNEEQKTSIQNKIIELRNQQASREEIHTAIGEMLQSFGVELPENWQEGPNFRQGRGHRGRCWHQLNKQQKQELNAIIKKLKANGATKNEIREAIGKKLKEFGYEPSQIKGQNGDRTEQQPSNLDDPISNTETLQARNYPNPFNPETSIEFTLQKPEKVLLRVFNVNGQLVRTLLDTETPSGIHTIQWNGRDEHGMLVPSGLYFYRIDAGANSLTQGMILMK